MLSSIEKVLFVLAVAASLYFTYRGVRRIIRTSEADTANRIGAWPGSGSAT